MTWARAVAMSGLFLLVILMVEAGVAVSAPSGLLMEREKIEALIRHIEGLKDAVFIRNDREYDARAAANFLRAKWKASEAQVKTAREFIAKVASVSSTTGKPYLIRFKDGRVVMSGEYLLEELRKLE